MVGTYGIEYSEMRAGEMQTLMRRFPTRAEADDFFASMKRAGTPADAIRKDYPVIEFPTLPTAAQVRNLTATEAVALAESMNRGKISNR